MEEIVLTIVASIISFIIGSLLTRFIDRKKLDELNKKIEALTTSITILDNKLNDRGNYFYLLKDDVSELEKRVNNLEVKTQWLEKNIH